MNAAGHVLRYWLASPPPSGLGAIAIIEIAGPIENVFAALAMAPVMLGQSRVRSFGGIDDGLVAVWTADRLTLMPHGGPAVVEAVIAWLEACGLKVCELAASGFCPARDAYFEARNDIEAHVLAALSRTRSPLAAGLLLDTTRRWRDFGDVTPASEQAIAQHAHSLRHLLREPLVALVGRPNIGKSSLLNALAKDTVSIVADERGTTRDYVGARVMLAGLAVRVVDTPGIDTALSTSGPDESAAALARELIARADLVVSCGDFKTPPLPRGALIIATDCQLLTVCLRGDLLAHTEKPAWANGTNLDAIVSALWGTGIESLVTLMRDRLVRSEDLASVLPWRLWE